MVAVDDEHVPWSRPGWANGPSDELVLGAGGWDGRYARLLRKVFDRRAAVAVVDTNGDGAELEVDVWHYEAGGWSSGSSCGLGSLGAERHEASGRSGRVVWAAGVLEPGSSVTVRFGQVQHRMVVPRNGLWVWVRDAGPGEPDDLVWPEVTWIPPDPAGRARLRFRSEVGADSPFWADDIDEGSDCLVNIADLPLPADLARELTEWASVAWHTPGDAETRRRGRELCTVCARELQAEYELLWDG